MVWNAVAKANTITNMFYLAITSVCRRRLLGQAGNGRDGHGFRVGIDRVDGDESLRLTIQMIIPAQLGEPGGGQAAGAKGSPFFTRTATGKTVSEAVERFQFETGRNVLWSHTKVIIIDEKLAREGVLHILQYFERSVNFREGVFIFVARDATAEAILRAGHKVEKLSAKAMETAVKNGRARGTVPGSDLFQFTTAISNPRLSPLANSVKLLPPPAVAGSQGGGGGRNQPRINVSGAAVFKGDKMVGWIGPTETRGLMWLLDKVSEGVVVVDSPAESGKQVGLRITGSKSKIQPEMIRDGFSFDVRVKVEADVEDEECRGGLDDPAYLKDLEQALSRTVGEEVMGAVTKLQEWRTDPVGFGSAVKLKYPGRWRGLRQEWQDGLFPAARMNIEVTAGIKKTGTVYKSKMR